MKVEGHQRCFFRIQQVDTAGWDVRLAQQDGHLDPGCFGSHEPGRLLGLRLHEHPLAGIRFQAFARFFELVQLLLGLDELHFDRWIIPFGRLSKSFLAQRFQSPPLLAFCL